MSDQDQTEKEPISFTHRNFLESVVNFLQVNNPGKESRLVVLIESETGEFWLQSMWQNEIWVRGMLHTALAIDVAKINHQINTNAERFKDAVAKQELMATEVKGKAQ